jgi:hypothetical protein
MHSYGRKYLSSVSVILSAKQYKSNRSGLEIYCSHVNSCKSTKIWEMHLIITNVILPNPKMYSVIILQFLYSN